MKNALFVITLLASAMAFAGEDELLAKLDTDKSGALSAEEAKADARLSGDMFAKLDANQDGQLAADELKALPAPEGEPTQ